MNRVRSNHFLCPGDRERSSHGYAIAMLVLAFAIFQSAASATANDLPAAVRGFFHAHCLECHGAENLIGGAELETLLATGLPASSADDLSFRRWVRIYDRIFDGEMPPKTADRPDPNQANQVLQQLKESLLKADEAQDASTGRTPIRRMTRAEYENTIRDLFDMPGISLQSYLPPDGTANGYDKNSDALSISHIHLAKYMEAADRTLELAIAQRPTPPKSSTLRLSLLDHGGQAAYLSMHGDCVLLKNGAPDPVYPPAGAHKHIDLGAHELMDVFETDSSVGIFRREDESVNYYFRGHTTVYPGRYRVRLSTWSFQWDKGAVFPSRRTEALRLAAVQLTGDGRGGQHPNYTLRYLGAPSLQPTEYALEVWLNENEILGCDVSSLAPTAVFNRQQRAMNFQGPAIAVDWLDIDGPINDQWPAKSHQFIFGDLPIEKWVEPYLPDNRPPLRTNFEGRWLGVGKNAPEPSHGIWTVQSKHPVEDARKILTRFLTRAFRRPVSEAVRNRYLKMVEHRLQSGDCFETAILFAVRTALCSPDFLYHVECNRCDDFTLANRMSYFLWNSIPDERLIGLAERGILHEKETMTAETERMLADPKFHRFIDDFLGQWLKLRQIAANDPDKLLYPEFSPYLQESMVAETRAYFRELLERDLDPENLIQSDFAMLNEVLADHYGIEGVAGPDIRRVAIQPSCIRGGLLTQGSILKITANGTTTSPVPRGAFVMDRILGRPPDPPPASVPAVEPDVRGATTIRELLDKHRSDPSCAACHARIDPTGFALESYDVIGGYRTRYRSLEFGDPAPRGKIDPSIGIRFRLGPSVDSSGKLPDGRTFQNVRELQSLLVSDKRSLLKNLARQWLVYSTGRAIAFRDREGVEAIVAKTESLGGGLRSLLKEVVLSTEFQTH